MTRDDTIASLLESADDRDVLGDLVPLVYDELRELAHHQLRGERSHTLQTTDLVHEAYLRLADATRVTKRGRAYFFAAAARAMRQVLVAAARSRNRVKRGGGQAIASLDDGLEIAEIAEIEGVEGLVTRVLEVDQALERLAAEEPRPAQIVELRFFGGLTVEEVAETLDIAQRTVKRDWAWARAWLYRELAEPPAS